MNSILVTRPKLHYALGSLDGVRHGRLSVHRRQGKSGVLTRWRDGTCDRSSQFVGGYRYRCAPFNDHQLRTTVSYMLQARPRTLSISLSWHLRYRIVAVYVDRRQISSPVLCSAYPTRSDSSMDPAFYHSIAITRPISVQTARVARRCRGSGRSNL